MADYYLKYYQELKKYYSEIVVLAMMVLSLGVASCSKSGDDETSSKIQLNKGKLSGKWKFAEINARELSSGWTPIVGDIFLQLNDNGSSTLTGKGTYRFKYGDNYMNDIVLGEYYSWKVGYVNEKDGDGIIWLYYKNAKSEETFNGFYFKFNSHNEVIFREPSYFTKEYKLIRQN